ncbi:MAG: hypothetical protein U0237_20130 [Thermoleophilia bacterium]
MAVVILSVLAFLLEASGIWKVAAFFATPRSELWVERTRPLLVALHEKYPTMRRSDARVTFTDAASASPIRRLEYFVVQLRVRHANGEPVVGVVLLFLGLALFTIANVVGAL